MPVLIEEPARILAGGLFSARRMVLGVIANIKKPTQLPGSVLEKPVAYYLRLAFSSMRRARSLASSAVC